MERPPWDQVRRQLKEEAFGKLTASRLSKSPKFTGFRRSLQALPLSQSRLPRHLYPLPLLDWITLESLVSLPLCRPVLIQHRTPSRRLLVLRQDYSLLHQYFLIHPLDFLIHPLDLLIHPLIQPRLLDPLAYLYRQRRVSRRTRR